MSNAIKSQGTVLEIDTDGGSPYVYMPVGEVRDVPDIDGGEAADIDVTHLGSTAREYIIGLQDGGTIALSGNLVPQDAGQAEMREARRDQTLRHFRVTFTDSAPSLKAEFDAFVKRFSASLAVDSQVTFNATLRVTGLVSWSDA